MSFLLFFLTKIPVDHVGRSLTVAHSQNAQGRSLRHALTRFVRVGADVRRQYDILHCLEFLRDLGFVGIYVNACSGQMTILQRLDERVRIHHSAARGVYKHSAPFHLPDYFAADKAFCFFVQRAVD